VIPRAVDEYWQFRANYPNQPLDQKLGNPVHHIHAGEVPEATLPVTYGLLLNLVSLPGVADRETAWKFVQRYAPGTSPERDPELDELIGLAVNYARDLVVPALKRRAPTEPEAAALRDLDSELAQLHPDTPADEIQNRVFEVGKQHYGKERLRDWFGVLYETLLGSSQGPRMGSFIALYGIDNSRRLIAEALATASA
jgi:lysyl-tRNA synthetase class 1